MVVKNLPTYITEKRLREHFSTRGGELTDVRLIHKADGTSRRVAFLGFKHERDAQTARDYFDKTYLDISKLKVDLVVVCILNYPFFVFFLPAHGHNFSPCRCRVPRMHLWYGRINARGRKRTLLWKGNLAARRSSLPIASRFKTEKRAARKIASKNSPASCPRNAQIRQTGLQMWV